jgi:XTP/dITP diphosphohydrolase
MEIVLATKNPNKLREFRQMLEAPDIRIVSLENFPDSPAVTEDGETFAQNALKKARTIARHTGRLAIADDSGLEVDHLCGKPGIYSARFAGEHADDDANNCKLLKDLEGVPPEKRGAGFKCVIAAAAPEGEETAVEGICRGTILTAPRGTNGFGYDPLFFEPENNMTFAEMSAEQKNSVSHRFRAIQKLKERLPAFLQSLQHTT